MYMEFRYFWEQKGYIMGAASSCSPSVLHDRRRKRSGSVVECLTRYRVAEGSSLIGVTALCP